MIDAAPVTPVLLAAGSSRRLGRPKQLERFGGASLVQRAVAAAVGAELGPVVVVLGAHADDVRGELAGSPAVIAVDNPDFAAGVGTSIRRGVAAAPPGAVLLFVCDQVAVTASHLALLVATFRAARPVAVASAYAGAVGVPAVFSEALRPELLALRDDEGGRVVLARREALVRTVVLTGGDRDVDTEADVASLGRLEQEAP